MKEFDFPKSERLTGRTRIDRLFAQGERITTTGLVVIYRLGEEQTNESLVQVLMAAPKKRFRKAVQRNRIKRLLKEGYRKHKTQLVATCREGSLSLDVAWVYKGSWPPNAQQIEDEIILSLQRLQSICKRNPPREISKN